MDDMKSRLSNCFSVVFPGVPRDDIICATQSTLSKWDSIAVVTLANVIEEEFGFPVNFDRLPEFDSFERILAYIDEEVQVLPRDSKE